MSTKQRIGASTTVTSDKFTFTWKIENYSSLKTNFYELIDSPTFCVGSNNKLHFKLELYPEGEDEEDSGHISLFLHPVIDSEEKPDELVCKCIMSAINGTEVIQKLTMHRDFAAIDFDGDGWTKFYDLKHIDKLVTSEDTVTIQCELEILKKYIALIDYEIIYSTDETIDTIKFDFSNREEFSDVKLIVEEQEIPAHKIILAAASPVFRALFTHDMLENQNNTVEINSTPGLEVSKDIVTEMLRFIYTGKYETNVPDDILDLLKLADRYQIDNLKYTCERMLWQKLLCGSLKPERAVDLLMAAHMHQAKRLEREAIEFIANRMELLSEKMKEITDPDIWINLLQSVVKTQMNVS